MADVWACWVMVPKPAGPRQTISFKKSDFFHSTGP